MMTLTAYFINSVLAAYTGVLLWTESFLRHCCPDNIFTTSGTKMTLSMKVLFRGSQRYVVVSELVLALCPVQGRNGGATYQSYFSLCPILTHTCTHCFVVEHENKNTLPQVYQVSTKNGHSQKCFLYFL